MNASGATSLAPYVRHFAWVMAAFCVAFVVAIRLLHMENNAPLFIGVIMASAVSAAQKFLGERKRAFQGLEALRMSLYSLLVAMALVAAGVGLHWALLTQGLVPDWGPMAPFAEMAPQRLGSVLGGYCLAAFCLLYVSYGFIQRLLHARMLKSGEV